MTVSVPMSQPPAWIGDYIQKPYVNGARGPEAYDCYGLMVAVMRDKYGLTPPMFDGKMADRDRPRGKFLSDIEGLLKQRSGWRQVGRPQPGDGILLRFGGFEAHCGVVVATRPRPTSAKAAGWMLHIHEGVSVSVAEWDGPAWNRRVAGFWRYVGGGNER